MIVALKGETKFSRIFEEAVVLEPFKFMLSFNARGIPAKSGNSSPLAIFSSTFFAVSSAISFVNELKAPSFSSSSPILAHRGANAQIKKSDINFDAIKNSKLLYIAPMNGDSTKVLDDIANFANDNNVYVCFNAGSSSIKKGFNYLKKILENANIVVLNKEEASLATQIQVRPDTRDEKYSESLIHPDVKDMFKKLKVRDYQIIVITDGGKGAYAYDGKDYYYCPVFDGPVVSTLGAGDAFASTFCAALGKTNADIGKALMYASVNSAGVVSKFGATEGLLTFDEIEKKLAENPDYKYKLAD